MSAPITIVVTPTGSHLSDTNSGYTWCGEQTGRWPTFALDFGEGAKDCKRCAKERRTTS